MVTSDSRKVRYAMAALVIVAAVVRLYGLGFGLVFDHPGYVSLPRVRPDEELVWQRALSFFGGDLNPHYFINPGFFPYLIAFLDLAYLAGKCVFVFHGALGPLQQSIAMNPSDLILLSRIVVALLGSATVAAVYALGARLFGKAEGLLAAFFLAFAYLHVRDSHFGVTDVPVVFMVCAGMLCIERVWKRGRWRDYLCAGACTGLAIATKWGAGFLLFPLVAAHCLRAPLKLRDPRIYAALMLVFAGFFAGTPYVLLAWPEFLGSILPEAALHGFGASFGGYWHHLRVSFWYGLGWPLVAASLAGIVAAFKKYPAAAWLMAAFCLPYFLVVGSEHYSFVRYMLPLVPFACLAAAVAVREGCRRFFGGRTAVVACCAVACMLPSLGRVYWFDRALALQDTRLIAGQWIERHIGAERPVAFLTAGYYVFDYPGVAFAFDFPARHQWPLPFFGTAPQHGYSFRAIDAPAYAHERPRIAAGQFDYVIVDDVPQRGKAFDLARVLRELAPAYDMVFSVKGSGYRPGMVSEEHDAFYVPFAGVKEIVRPGPDFYILKRKAP